MADITNGAARPSPLVNEIFAFEALESENAKQRALSRVAGSYSESSSTCAIASVSE